MNTKTWMCVVAMLLTTVAAAAQTLAEALAQIEENNTTLRAMRAQLNADKAKGRSTLALDAPEVEFSYLWGSPAPMPGRKDVSVKQSFDFGTLTGSKRRVVQAEAEVNEMSYQTARQAILLEAEKVLIQLAYADTLLRLGQRRLNEARLLSQAWQKKIANGAALAIDASKIDLEQTAIENYVSRIALERDTWQSELVRLNGGLLMHNAQCTTNGHDRKGVMHNYQNDFTLKPFDEWYADIVGTAPQTQYATALLRLAEAEVVAARRDNLPSVSLGYVGELIKDDNYQGVSVGMAIPIWGSRKRVQAARASRVAAEETKQDAALQLRHALQQKYERTRALQQMAERCEKRGREQDIAPRLRRALDEGNLTLQDYLTEMRVYHENTQNIIEAWRDYHLSLAELAVFGGISR